MKQSPYFGINYGWGYGADGWDVGMDENLLVMSLLSKNSVNAIVPEVPVNPSEGDSYVVSSDNSVRFFVDGTWGIIYPADGWRFTTEDNGLSWMFDGGVPVQRVDPDNLSHEVVQLDTRVGNVEDHLDTVDQSISNLSDIPNRVQELETGVSNKADQTSLDEVDGRVDDLELYNGQLDNTLASMELNIGSNTQTLSTKINSVVQGDGISVDNTDPINPTVSLDTSVLEPVATSGLYSDLTGTPTLGTAAAQDTTAFDPAGSASGVQDALMLILDQRMSSAARTAVDALDAATATLEELILALQS